jgi:hypothetical protein
MTIDELLVQLLVPSVLGKLYPLTAPDQTKTPYSTYMLISDENLTTHDSPLPSTRRWNAQFTTYSESYGTARTLGSSIQSTLVGYTDNFITGITPKREHPTWDDMTKLYGWIVELLITEHLV